MFIKINDDELVNNGYTLIKEHHSISADRTRDYHSTVDKMSATYETKADKNDNVRRFSISIIYDETDGITIQAKAVVGIEGCWSGRPLSNIELGAIRNIVYLHCLNICTEGVNGYNV